MSTPQTLDLLPAALPCTDPCDAFATSAVDGVGVPTNTDNVAKTTFVNDAKVELSSVSTFKNSLHRTSKEDQDIKRHLGRPVRVTNGTLANSYSNLYILNVNAFNIFSYFPRITNIYGAFGFRATLCFKVEVASNPFTPGVLRLSNLPITVPNAGTSISTSGGSYWGIQNYITPMSSTRGVYLDIVESTTAVLKLPWVHPQEYLAFSTSSSPSCGLWGNFVLTQYLPTVVATGTALPTFTIWAWLEDVELIGAAPPTTVLATPQSGYDAIEAEMANTKQPLSKMFALTARGIRTMAGIPLLSSFAGTASWAVRGLGRTAAAFGWSKPRDDTKFRRVFVTTSSNMHMKDAVNPAITLSAAADNHIPPMPGFAGSDLDEMSFEYLLSKKVAILGGSLNFTDTYSMLKWAAAVSPSACFSQKLQAAFPMARPGITASGAGPSVAGSVIFPSTIFYVGQCFRHWRGDIVYTMRIAKTKLHTGKLLFYFIPDPNFAGVPSATVPTLPAPTLGAELSFHSAVWDLREGNVFEFTVPYTSPNTLSLFTSSTGTVGAMVIEPLNGPPSVGTSTPFTIEVSGKNFQFGAPVGPPLPQAPSAPAVAAIYSQSGNEEVDIMALTHGEDFKSVKQLISRGTWVIATAGVYTPFPYTYMTPTGTGPYTATPVSSGTILDYFGGLYVLYRGSVVASATNDVTSTSGIISMAFAPTKAGCPVAFQPTNNNMAATIFESGGQATVSLPWYHVNPSYFIRPCATSTTAGNFADVVPEFNLVFNKGGNSTTAKLCVSAGDDFQYGLYIGVPPLVIPVALSTNWSGSTVYFPTYT